jgi:hypothetical protein
MTGQPQLAATSFTYLIKKCCEIWPLSGKHQKLARLNNKALILTFDVRIIATTIVRHRPSSLEKPIGMISRFSIKLIVLFAAFSLIGCVAYQSSNQEVLDWASAKRIADQLFSQNVDLCGRSICHLELSLVDDGYDPSTASGAFVKQSDEGRIMFFTRTGLKNMSDDHLRAYVIGHEWAHVLLGHIKLPRSSPKMENKADCVGTILAIRAGFPIQDLDIYMDRLSRQGIDLDSTRPGYSSYRQTNDNIRRVSDRAFAVIESSGSIGWSDIVAICNLERSQIAN